MLRLRPFQLARRAMSINFVSTQNAPPPIGHYSQATSANGFVFVSGCVGMDPKTGSIVEGGIEAEAKQALINLREIVKSSGSSIDKVVKTTVFMKNMSDFPVMNKAYAEIFGDHKPSRSAVEVARLPKDVLVEVECIALSADK
ncbi:YjgF-like protein [Sistotremastrum niveocremeum HHB9708]|uniref:YjgF-like protein n=2 Tax=Sistotremastraceae TaxID=3402574 RepID=A0A164U9V2_9AGAM|nr:YjgF-like protein [Sistotremastrum niveocremeum HHB9708]KZT44286.1 YjgF-like protein [Sistotremastrum suecicum HHB10207 ss-3]